MTINAGGFYILSILSLLLSTVLCFILTKVTQKIGIGLDIDTNGPQKFHHLPVPRIGGFCIFTAIFVIFLSLKFHFGTTLMFSSLPAFIGGIYEDLTQRAGVKNRLFLTMIAATIGYFLMGAKVNRIGISIVDPLLQIWVFSLLFTIFAVGGIAHGINMIDGFNGIAGGTAIFMGLSIAYVSYINGDSDIFIASLVLVGAIFGFLVFNFPRGKIFLGDGGAYFIGFYLGELLVLLVKNNPNVSAWFPMMVLAYPVTEVFFSIYRKKFLMGRSPTYPDKLHLHMIVYRRIVKKRNSSKYHNAMTAPFMWTIALLAIVLGTIFWYNTSILILGYILFVIFYVVLYRRLVKFKSPKIFFTLKNILTYLL